MKEGENLVETFGRDYFFSIIRRALRTGIIAFSSLYFHHMVIAPDDT